MSLLTGVTVRPSGEAAVVLEVGDRVDPALHERVLALDEAIASAPPTGVVELVPTYRSLLLHLDPAVTTPDEVLAALGSMEAPPARDATAAGEPREVPVSFAGGDAPDLPTVARTVGLSPGEVVDLLTGSPLRLYCYGFAPGFAYLGGLPPVLAVPRRTTPRAPVPSGSVLLAAGQAALCPRPMPTGWWVVGRTAQTLFDPTAAPPVPDRPGDLLRLVAVAA